MQCPQEKYCLKEGAYSMDLFEAFLNKMQGLLKDYCEFRNICPYFYHDSHTCTMTGGSHCGKHRSLKAEKTTLNSRIADFLAPLVVRLRERILTLGCNTGIL
jgi:hypothetical protein